MKWPKWFSIFWIFGPKNKATKENATVNINPNKYFRSDSDLPKRFIPPHKDVGMAAAAEAVRLAAVRDHACEVQEAEYQKACLDFKAFLDQCFLSCSPNLEKALANNVWAENGFKYEIDDPMVVSFLKPILFYADQHNLDGGITCAAVTAFHGGRSTHPDAPVRTRFMATPAPYYVKEFHALTKGHVSLEITLLQEYVELDKASRTYASQREYSCISYLIILFSVHK